jgi:hypothetical protein
MNAFIVKKDAKNVQRSQINNNLFGENYPFINSFFKRAIGL